MGFFTYINMECPNCSSIYSEQSKMGGSHLACDKGDEWHRSMLVMVCLNVRCENCGTCFQADQDRLKFKKSLQFVELNEKDQAKFDKADARYEEDTNQWVKHLAESLGDMEWEEEELEQEIEGYIPFYRKEYRDVFSCFRGFVAEREELKRKGETKSKAWRVNIKILNDIRSSVERALKKRRVKEGQVNEEEEVWNPFLKNDTPSEELYGSDLHIQLMGESERAVSAMISNGAEEFIDYVENGAENPFPRLTELKRIEANMTPEREKELELDEKYKQYDGMNLSATLTKRLEEVTAELREECPSKHRTILFEEAASQLWLNEPETFDWEYSDSLLSCWFEPEVD